MKKILLVSAVALCAASTASAHNWYAGVGLGWKQSNYKGDFKALDVGAPNGSSQTAKLSMSKEGFLAKVFAGHKFKGEVLDWFVQLNGGFDASKKAKKDVSLNIGLVNMNGSTSFVRRLGFLGVDLGVSKDIKGVDCSFKIGALVSQFEVGYSSTQDPAYTGKNTTYAVGFAPGIGLEKNLGMLSFGMTYEYQMHTALKHRSSYQRVSSEGNVLLKPRDHVVMMQLKKSF